MANEALWLAATLMAALNFGFISWGVKGHFVATEGVAPGMRVLAVLTIAGFAWFIWLHLADGTAQPGADRNAAGLVLLSLAAALFWWAVDATRVRRLTLAFSADQPAFLHVSGPYAWVRHPFYVSYGLFWVATAVLCAERTYWLVPVVMIAVYVRAARGEEAKFAASRLAGEYASYKSRTALLPRLRGAGRTRSET